jgi:transmembrane 9 superfamily protein 2/4
VRTNPIPRQVPDQVWYMKAAPSILMGGVLPFGVVFVELFFILSSIWQHRFYYLFGFMALVLVILVITCAEITIVMCYFQLCSEDYHWWWRAYMTSGASALYLFVYAGYYLLTRIHIAKATVASAAIFFGYIAILSYGFFVLTGFTGFISCFFFVRTIYASIKVD